MAARKTNRITMTHHATRYVEFWLIVFMIAWGIGVGANPMAMSDPIYRVMLEWAPSQSWSATAGSVGIVHFASWWHNGHGMWWTGPLRAWGCVATAIVVGLMALGAYHAIGIGPASIGYAAASCAAFHSACANVLRYMRWRGMLKGAVR